MRRFCLMGIFLKIIPNALKNFKRKKTSRGRYLNMQSIIELKLEFGVGGFCVCFRFCRFF